MRYIIPNDATIGSIFGWLRDPQAYLGGVLENMTACKDKFGTVVVRIDTTGVSRVPHYRIEPGEGDAHPTMNVLPPAAQPCFSVRNGASHNPLDWGADQLRMLSWSSNSMTIGEIRQLLSNAKRVRSKSAASKVGNAAMLPYPRTSAASKPLPQEP